MTKIMAGIDEAGRGPVIGPMVMAIVCASQEDISFLNKIGVKDSKLLSPTKRLKLSRMIRQRLFHVIIKVSPKKIDSALADPSNSLNILEARTSASLINRLALKTSFDHVMMDLPDKNKTVYLSHVRKNLSKNIFDLSLDAEFKADLNYAVVSAASIIAKVARDASLRTWEKKLGLKIGSGYPSDPVTISSLKNNFEILKEHGLLRLSWKTVKNFLLNKSQSSLADF